MFECEHCHTNYTSERFLLKHSCKIMEKKKIMKSLLGKRSFNFYIQYLESKKCYNSDIETFIHSKLFTTFTKFTTFVDDKKIPDVNLYMKFVNKYSILPAIWTNSIIYSAYLKEIDSLSPLESVEISINSIQKLSKIFECESSEVLPKLYIAEILSMLKSRHISPWYFINSPHFETIVSNPKITKNEHYVLELFINPKKWNKKFQKHIKEVALIKSYLLENNL